VLNLYNERYFRAPWVDSWHTRVWSKLENDTSWNFVSSLAGHDQSTQTGRESMKPATRTQALRSDARTSLEFWELGSSEVRASERRAWVRGCETWTNVTWSSEMSWSLCHFMFRRHPVCPRVNLAQRKIVKSKQHHVSLGLERLQQRGDPGLSGYLGHRKSLEDHLCPRLCSFWVCQWLYLACNYLRSVFES
jgi:hypothetical protein